jgi:hypothetical protein
VADEYRRYLNKKHINTPNSCRDDKKYSENGTNTDEIHTNQNIEMVERDYAAPLRNLVQPHKVWSIDRVNNNYSGRCETRSHVNDINTGLHYDDIKIHRGLSDDECEKIADYVALHNAFEAMDIAAVRALKADVIRYSKMLSRDNTKLYDFLRMPDMFIILEMTMNKRLTHELAFSTMFATNVTLQDSVNSLHKVSQGNMPDARMNVFKQLQATIYDNLYSVINGGSKLPSN